MLFVYARVKNVILKCNLLKVVSIRFGYLSVEEAIYTNLRSFNNLVFYLLEYYTLIVILLFFKNEFVMMKYTVFLLFLKLFMHGVHLVWGSFRSSKQ